MIRYHAHPSPIGPLLLAANEQEQLVVLGFAQGKRARTPEPDWQQAEHITGVLATAVQQLSDYFAGKRVDFDLPLAPQGTEFQLAVWQGLREIPYGQTWSYAQLAEHIGRPRAMRAVGAANGANPLPVIVPCHRVIGANGSLTGFGGGIDAKRFLLNLEASADAGPLFR